MYVAMPSAGETNSSELIVLNWFRSNIIKFNGLQKFTLNFMDLKCKSRRVHGIDGVYL